MHVGSKEDDDKCKGSNDLAEERLQGAQQSHFHSKMITAQLPFSAKYRLLFVSPNSTLSVDASKQICCASRLLYC